MATKSKKSRVVENVIKGALEGMAGSCPHVKPKKTLFEPQKGKLLVGRKAEEVQTKSGLFIPETAKEKPQEVTVLATHPENIYKVNDRLLMGRYAGTDIELNGTKLLILPEDEVLGRLSEE